MRFPVQVLWLLILCIPGKETLDMRNGKHFRMCIVGYMCMSCLCVGWCLSCPVGEMTVRAGSETHYGRNKGLRSAEMRQEFEMIQVVRSCFLFDKLSYSSGSLYISVNQSKSVCLVSNILSKIINRILLSFFSRSRGDLVMTQSLLSLFFVPGESIPFSCRSSESLLNNDGNTYLIWYYQNPGQRPKGLIYRGSNWLSAVPDRFRGSGSKTEFTLLISRMESEDVEFYYCIQATNIPHTVI